MGEKKLLAFRPFKIPAKSAFISPEKAIEFMEADLAKSGLTPDDLRAYAHGALKIPREAEVGYVIPYFYPDGQPIVDGELYPAMYRVRLKQRPNIQCPRYTQPSKDTLLANGLPGNVPYFPPYERDGDTLVICEGEKKTIAAIKHLGLDAIGIGGCTTWNHEWIFEAAVGKKVMIIPDADVMRYDIAKQYGGLAAELLSRGCNVEIVVPPDKLDDWIVAGGTREEFDSLPRLNPNDLVLTGEQLIAKYNLTFQVVGKEGKKVVHQHSSNIMTLMEMHPAFPVIWDNADNGRVYIGEEETEPGLTEMDVANYFQRNLGMDKVSHKLIYPCIGALAKRNARSPMLDWIKSQVWDGEKRLASWMIRHWGVKDTAYVREVSAKWLVSSCARLDVAGTKVDWMLITIGPQGTGKTSMPDILFRGNSIVTYGHDGDKDERMLLHAGLCVGFDELDSFSRKDQNTLKAMVTCREDMFRKPYGASHEPHKRRSVLYGCGNKAEFLSEDPSGYRRYAIIEVPRLLDFSGLEEEVPQLWAEAWGEYLAGCKFWEVEGASEHAEKYVVESPLSNLVETVVTGRLASEPHFTATQLYLAMGMEPQKVLGNVARDVSGILTGMGYIRIRKKVPGTNTSAQVWVKKPNEPEV